MKIIIEWINNIILSQWQLILAFFISQLINVILSTIKSVLTVKGTKFTATLINTISYTLNAAVINQIGKVDDLFLVCIFTAITNIIGVSFSLWLLDKLRKEQLWRISATVKTEFFNDLIHELSENNIEFITYNTSWKKRVPIDVFSNTRSESEIVKTIFNKYNVKYTISVNHGEL